MRRLLPTLALAGLTLTACSDTVDIEAVGAQRVPGTHNLWRFCDGTSLIYFTNWDDRTDEFQFLIPEGCRDGQPTLPTNGGHIEQGLR